MKKPDSFKIQILSAIKDLFETTNPIYAGFGNRETDCRSYFTVGVQKDLSFRINSKGLIQVIETGKTYQGYTELNTLRDKLFPPLKKETKKIESKIQNVEKL